MSVFVLRSAENMMPTDHELNRVINNLQELLYTASDVSHDRCVKVLTARAKVWYHLFKPMMFLNVCNLEKSEVNLSFFHLCIIRKHK